jgi:xylose isomerase
LIAAAEMLEAGTLTGPVAERYAPWRSPEAQAVLSGQRSLAEVADAALTRGLNPQPRSGRQEYLESLVNRFV